MTIDNSLNWGGRPFNVWFSILYLTLSLYVLLFLLLSGSAAPTNCTRNFMVLNTTSSTITIKLTVSNCAGSMPTYRVTARSMSSGVVTTALNISSTVYLMSSLEADTAYDVELVDNECLNIILNRLSVMTNMDPISQVILFLLILYYAV